MTRRRIVIGLLVLLVAALAGAGLVGQRAWQTLLSDNGIRHLDWQGLDVSRSSLTLDRVSLQQVRPERETALDARSLTLDWDWHWPSPRITAITVQHLELDVRQRAAANEPTEKRTALNLPASLPVWLPRKLTVAAFSASLPCATGTCPLSGRLTASRSADAFPIRVDLTLDHDDHRVETRATLDGTGPEDLSLMADVTIDSEQTLTLQTDYRRTPDAGTTSWHGNVNLPRIPQTDWLLTWLKSWHPMPVDDLPPQPEAGSLQARWQLRAPAGEAFSETVSGTLDVEGHLPQPWPLPGVATVQGDIQLALTADQGQWLAKAVEADLKLSQLGHWVTAIPSDLRPETLTLSIQPSEKMPGPETDRPLLPVALSLSSRGAANIDVTGQFAVATQAPWLVRIGPTRVQASRPRLAIAGWTLQKPRLDARVTGQADTGTLTLSLGKSSSLRLAQLSRHDNAAMPAIDTLSANLATQRWSLAYDLDDKTLKTLSGRGPLALAAGNIRHPQLKPQRWSFSGKLNTSLKRTALDGRLNTQSNAAADIKVRVPYGGTQTIDGTIRLAGPSDARAWAQTLTAWPATLDISGGQADITIQLKHQSASDLTLHTRTLFSDLEGTFNRTAWTGLNGPLTLNLDQGQLSATAPSLTLKTVNPGVPIGPVTLGADYEGPGDQLSAGTLHLTRARGEALGGQVRVAPATWQLSDLPLNIPLELERLDLARLMALYPAEDLDGTGTLSGRVPVVIDADGVHVAEGRITALAPGGRLRLPGDRVRAFAQGNAAMEIVADAMKNFHYSVLDSTIDYARDGTLQLGLHIEGNNPDVHNGQPVVLNINLEEDIPALLTSLQLSGRVNETVTERVKKLMQKRQDTKDSKH